MKVGTRDATASTRLHVHLQNGMQILDILSYTPNIMANHITATRIAQANPIPSSSPAFGTPAHPILPRRTNPIAPPQFKPSTILPILLPPATLRPLAFRTFTKKHNLTLTSSALGALASFIGKHCGSGWREDGLAEGVLEEAAKMWKKESTIVIVDGDSPTLKNMLKGLESCMVGGKVQTGKSGLSRQGSFAFTESGSLLDTDSRPSLNSHESFGMSGLEVQDEDGDENKIKDPREWIKVVSAFEQPRLSYNVSKKNYDKYVDMVLSGVAYANTCIESQRNLHCYLHPPTRQNISVNATTSSSNGYCVTSLSSLAQTLSANKTRTG
jgi:hypothetical protein